MADILDRAIAASPDYPTVLERLKTGNQNFLDLGCCFGQEYVYRVIYLWNVAQ